VAQVEFGRRPVQVTVPATSANLGPGFDTFGLALGRYDVVTAAVVPSGLRIEVSGQGADQVPLDERHLIIRAMRATFDRLGGQPEGLQLQSLNRIPHGRGLGSSAAAIVAGVELARSLVTGGRTRLDDRDALALASAIEGHPDNVAACLLGGLTLAWTAEGGAGTAIRLDPLRIRPVIFVPTEQSDTHAARAALPQTVPHADAAFNAGRAALLVVALTGRPELLGIATEDRLHQGYRADAMPASSALLAALRGAGLPAVISGAGSTVLAMARTDDELNSALGLAPKGWECLELPVAEGARAIEL
jgi:homoserine kinase